MKYLNIIFAFLFLISALLQFNDPDPALWVSVYLIGAYLCFTALRGEMNKRIFITALCFFLVLAGYLFFIPNGILDWILHHEAENILENMSEDRPWIERTREFLGLLILCLVLGLNLLFGNKKKLNPAGEMNSSHKTT